MKNIVKIAFAALVFSFVAACQPKKTEEATAPADSAAVETPAVDSVAAPADSTTTAPADSAAHH